MPIQLLPISLANQIAAGEVIERPASVVKELVENCLDAGATHIVVDIEQGGRRRIRVRDNGTGIPKAELPLALSRHATSKISSLADLEAIQSLGFRGEALASISSVARLTLTSATATQSDAWQVWVEGRDMVAELAPASHPQGTTVDVQDLFFNTPARRKFLRTDKTEFNHIDEVLRRIALARYDVRFQLYHNDKLVRQYTAVEQPEDYLKRIAQVCGTPFSQEAINVESESGAVRLWGWIAPAAACRHQADVQYFYVNGRMMRDRLLGHAVRQAYADTLPEDRVPTYVLYLELPAQDVDVNVHPAKHEVRFHQARLIHDFVLHAARQVLTAHAPQPANTGAVSRSEHGYTPSHAALAAQVQELTPRHRQVFPERPAVDRTALSELTRLLNPTVDTSEQASASVQVLTVVEQRFALVNDTRKGLGLLDLQRVQQRDLSQRIGQQLTLGLAGQPLLIPLKLTDSEVVQTIRACDPKQLALLGVRYELQGQSVIIYDVPSALRQSNIAIVLPQLLALRDQPEQLAAWLAQHQVQTHYSLTQAEHWLAQSQGSQDVAWIPLPLPPLPESLR